ncbi:MAG: hypothetical protein HQL69_24270, partial [Magnetococcales bacterium]|nr:hypothetical protein [Magnetococcales bacterium]
EIVQGEFNKPIFQTTPYRDRACPDATGNGKLLVRVRGDISRVPLGPDKSYRYTHEFAGRRIYWVPEEYLP